MPVLYPDLRFAVRSLGRGGMAIFVALATLVVALAATLAIYAVAQAVLFAPMPATDHHEVLWLARWTDDTPQGAMPVPTYFDWLERNRTLGSLGAYTDPLGFNLEGSPPERLRGVAVSAGFFPTLGVDPALGSVFGEIANQPGAPALAVISHSLWLRRFGGAANAVGRNLVLGGTPWEIAAVMPQGFHFPTPDVDLWLPMGTLHRSLRWENRSSSSLWAVGRLGAGVTQEQVRRDLERVTDTIAADTGVQDQPRPLVMALEEKILGSTRDSLRVLAGAVFFVLLIACANVANLLLARGFGRGEEVAVRMALGARRRDIVRLMLVESVALACAACALALALTGPLARRILVWVPSPGAVGDDLGVTPGVFVFALLLATVCGLAIGLPPAIRHSRQTPAATLRRGRRALTSGSRMQSAMVVAEVAVATALLVAAGLMLRTIDRLLDVETGFDAAGVLVQRLAPNHQRYGGFTDWLNLTDRLLEDAGSLATVQGAAVALDTPLSGSAMPMVRVAKPGQALRPDVLPLCINATVSESYFEVLGMQVVRGRAFQRFDDLEHPLVAIVDESLAAALWPGQDPVGQQLALEYNFPAGGYREGAQIEAIWREVVGVVPTTRMESLRGEPRFQAYVPLRQPPIHLRDAVLDFALLSKTRGEPLDGAPLVQAAVSHIDPSLPVYGARSLRGLIDDNRVQERLLSTLLSAFAVLALLLAAAGVYASLAHLVERRRRELGLRLALGADPARLLRQVAWRGVRLALWGALLGLVGSSALTHVLASSLYGVSRLDPLTFLAMPAVLLAATFLACLLPAWRAARLDPAECLRCE